MSLLKVCHTEGVINIIELNIEISEMKMVLESSYWYCNCISLEIIKNMGLFLKNFKYTTS